MTTTLAHDVGLTDDILALIVDRAVAADESGHLDEEVVATLRAGASTGSCCPAELGGYAVPPRRTVEIVEKLATADGSAAWAAAIGFGTNHFAGYLPYDGAAEVFADPDRGNAAVFAATTQVIQAGDGTLRLTGRWPFTSNCEQAGWVGLASRFPDDRTSAGVRATVQGDDPPDVGDIHRPTSDGEQRHVGHPFKVNRMHTCSFIDRPWPAGPLWRLPLFVVLAQHWRRFARRRPRRPR